MASNNMVHQVKNLHNDKTRERYEIVDAEARERLDAVEANVTSALAQISAAESRMNTAVSTQNGQIGSLDDRTETLEDGVDAINEALQTNVTTVNGQSGNVTLTATDVGALPDDTPIPQYLSDLHADADHQTVTAAEKNEWYDKIGRDEYSYLYDRVERVITQSGEPNVIDTILVNGVEVVPDERVVDIPDTTYSIGVSGHTLTLTDSDGHSQTASLPNDSYDDATLAGRVTDAERDIGSLQSAIANIELTAEAVSYGNNSTVKAALDSMAQTEASLTQTAQAIPGMQTLLNNTVSNEAEYVITSATAARTYAVGDYIVLNGVLYKVTSSISIGDTIDSNNTQRVYITDEITTVAEGLAEEAAAERADMQDDIEALQGLIGAGLSFGQSGGSYGYWVNGANFKSFRQPTGDAVAGDVLSGKTFSNASSDSLTGSMTNRGAVSKTLNCGGSYTVPAGYHNGSGTVTANSLSSQTGVDDGYTAATNATIRSGYQAWVNGSKKTGSMATLTSSNFSGSHSSSTAGAASNYVTKSTSAGYVANNTSVNTLAAGTSATIATTSATGTKTINCVPGYYNKISVNQTNAYNAGVTAGNGQATLLYAARGREDGASTDYVEASKTTTKEQTVTIKWYLNNWSTPCKAKVTYLIGSTETSISSPSTTGKLSGTKTVNVASGKSFKIRAYGGASTGGAVCHSSISAIVF